MSGGLWQLVAHGAQDIYITGNPQITFFVSTYSIGNGFALPAIERPLKRKKIVRYPCKKIGPGVDFYNMIYNWWYPIPVHHTAESLRQALIAADFMVRFGQDGLILGKIIEFYDYNDPLAEYTSYEVDFGYSN